MSVDQTQIAEIYTIAACVQSKDAIGDVFSVINDNPWVFFDPVYKTAYRACLALR